MSATDRELLELAAKAAGVTGAYYRSAHGADGMGCHDKVRGFYTWNPLTDDGDALRLAVKLSIGIRSHGPDHWQQPNTSVALYDVGECGGGRVTVHHGTDPSVATRRAIVRAAAEIGRALP